MRRYEIQITGFLSVCYVATTRAKARYKAYLQFREAYPITFGDFLRRIEWVRPA